MRQFPKICMTLVLLCLACLVGNHAFAQDACNDLANNEEWTKGLSKAMQLVNQGDYQKAKAESKKLIKICDKSPVLNYIQGVISDNLGQKSDALIYYVRASEATYRFSVDPEISKAIWYARYESEHPELNQENINANIKSIQDKAIEKEEALNAERIAMVEFYNEDTSIKNYKLMWTGVGIGLGGLVLLGTGIGLLIKNSDKDNDGVELIPVDPELYKNSPQIYDFLIDASEKQNKPLYAGYNFNGNRLMADSILIGLGSSLLACGIILTAVYGYQYTHSNIHYSFNVTKQGAQFAITF